MIAKGVTVTFKVTVPEGTNACYILGQFTGGNFAEMSKVDDYYTFTYELEETYTGDYRYASGPGWEYFETTEERPLPAPLTTVIK